MARIGLGALHEALQGLELVSEERFSAAVKSLLPAAEAPSPQVLSGLFRTFDEDSNGSVDQRELIAGCQALCSGDETTKLKLAFLCFDMDGDGHISPDELTLLLRGTIEPAVAQLHAAIDFASFSAEEPDLAAINDEAKGMAALSAADEAGNVKVELQTKAGTATISVPSAALSGGGDLGAGALSLDSFLRVLVASAMDKYDTDKNGTIEVDEFVAFARENPFLSVWFGHLADGGRGTSSWKDEVP